MEEESFITEKNTQFFSSNKIRIGGGGVGASEALRLGVNIKEARCVNMYISLIYNKKLMELELLGKPCFVPWHILTH